MTVKAMSQTDVVDVTDAYSVILTNESHTFPGSTTGAIAGSATTQVVGFLGATQVTCSVDVSAITAQDGGAIPTGVTVTKDSDATSPTLTIAVTTAVTSAFALDVPVVADGKVTIHKVFSAAIALTGATGDKGATGATGKGVSSTTVSYQASSSGTTIPTGTWSSSIPTVRAGQYLWTRTVMAFTDSTSTTAYSVGMMGATGGTGATGKGISGTAVTYQSSTSGTTAPTGTWSATIPTVSASQFLWTKTVTTYTDSTTTTAYSVGMMGATGAQGVKGATGDPGADALSLVITSSAGTIFKNSNSATTLTAHVFKGGIELSATQISALGTINWYKDGSSTSMATGQTLNISAGAVTSKATYVAQLEG